MTMNASPPNELHYEERPHGDDTLGVIYDPNETDAWISSSVTVEVGTSTGTGIRDETRYDPSTGAYRTLIDLIDVERLCLAVVTVVADIAEVDPVSLDPISEAADEQALAELIHGDETAPQAVSFELGGYGVTVSRDEILVRAPDAT